MNILLLGNGYDLNYQLPTAYRNFLLTIDFLTKHNLEDIKTVGDVFGNADLYTQDAFIKRSYDSYKDIYDTIVLDADKLKRICEIAKNNLWFSYFVKSFNRDVGWIDFEREVAFVISCFQSYFKKAELEIQPINGFENLGIMYVIMEAFNFFFELEKTANPFLAQKVKVAQKYTVEYPLKSGDIKLDKKKVIDELFNSLNDFISVLQFYLTDFVEETAKKLIDKAKISQLAEAMHTEVVVSLNYTNTFELFSPNTNVLHLHGTLDNKIVLGVNPNRDDNEETVDTAFIAFKKYYQRVLYGTDEDFLKFLEENTILSKTNSLLIMGHSLDVTDKDILSQLFDTASEIVILYHSEEAKAQYISNLVDMFGMPGFQHLRTEKHLVLVPLNDNVSNLVEKRNRSSNAYLNRQSTAVMCY